MHTHHRLTLAAVAVTLVACGGPTETTARLDARGGRLALESGTSVEVPQGALTREVEVTLREVRRGDDVTIEVEPRGLELEHPAEVSWADDGRAAERESGEALETEHHVGRAHLSMRQLSAVLLRHTRGNDRDGGQSHGRDDGDAGAGDDHGRDSPDAGDDHGRDAPDAGDDHGNDADAGRDGGDDHGHGGH